MNKLSYIVAGSGRISAVANGSSYTVEPDHPNYDEIKQSLNDRDADRFVNLVDIPRFIEQAASGKVKVANGVVYYKDTPVHNTLTERILWMLDEGFDVEPSLLFLENLMENPSKRAVKELYSWLEHKDIPITTDGHWLGYKKLFTATERLEGEPTDRPIYVDVHSRKIRQWMGKTVEMPRNEVDDDWGVDCSEGFHVGSAQYSFHGDVKVIVKVNPRDVVSVPSYDTHKCRVCRYEIVDVFKEDFSKPVVGPVGENLNLFEDDIDDYADVPFDDDYDEDEDKLDWNFPYHIYDTNTRVIS